MHAEVEPPPFRKDAPKVEHVAWDEYCELALSRRPLERVPATRGPNPPLRDRELGTVYVLVPRRRRGSRRG